MVSEKTQPQRTVLVVEEEASIRVAAADFLRSSAFRILEAAGGAEAVAMLSVDMSIDVVCLHMQMPGDPDSFALARWVQENRPNVRLLWTSDHIPGLSEPNSKPLSNPFNYEDLRNQIWCLLTRGLDPLISEGSAA
jgi:DNA-binding response OmpR family regulator